MFKSLFARYLVAFVLIVGISFAILTGIFTSMIRAYSSEEHDSALLQVGTAISEEIENEGIEDLKTHILSPVTSRIIFAFLKSNEGMEILVTDIEGEVLLTSLARRPNGEPLNFGELGKIDLGAFREKTEGEESYRAYEGTLDGMLPEKSRVYAKPITFDGVPIGYTVTARSIVSEDRIVGFVKSSVLNSCIWVMLAAVIAIYFISERIVHPLSDMTKATKDFAKGDFSRRVVVSGKDEISDLARAFNNMADELCRMEKMRNAFLANISHDLRTPMTTIAGFIDGINSGAIPVEKHEYYLGVISSEVHRLSRLVSQILDVSRLESGERKFNFTSFDVAEVARLILISLEQKIESKHLDVSFESRDTVMVYADKDAIYQVLYNLCHNAIKFSSDGGALRIRIETDEQKKVHVSVYDDGQIIDEDELPFVFDRFYKTDKSRGLDKNGVGLGLYISKTIIDAHGEKIGARIIDQRGCEFYFTLKQGDAQKRLPS